MQYSLKSTPDKKMTDGFKTELFNKIRSNKYVKSYWSGIVDEAEENNENIELDDDNRIVDNYLRSCL